MAYKTILLQVAIGLSLFFGCKTAKEDVHSIEKIENSLTPALVINGIHTEPLTLADAMKAVSYTHLTLPTICSV